MRPGTPRATPRCSTKGSLHTDESTSPRSSPGKPGSGWHGASATVLSWTFRRSNRAIIITDAAVNMFPKLEDKVRYHSKPPSTSPTPSASIESQSSDPVGDGNGQPQGANHHRGRKLLAKMADRGQITGGILDGPLALDNAINSPGRRYIKSVFIPR